MLGRVVRVNLDVGASVRRGDSLVELEAEAEQLALTEARRKLLAITPEMDDIRKEIAAEQQAIDAERQTGQVARDELGAVRREADAMLRLATEEATQLARLRTDGVISPIEYSRARAETERRDAAVQAADKAITRITTEHETRQRDRQVRIQRLRSALTRLDGDRTIADAAARRLEHEVERRFIRAPVDGRIAEAADLRAGTVVDEGQRLATIVPESPLRVVAQFSPASAIGRVNVGQPARVRLLGFPWVEYGTLSASVARVASEIRDGSVRVELSLDRVPSALPLSHALPATVEIEVERVRPASIVLRSLGGVLTRSIERPVSNPAKS